MNKRMKILISMLLAFVLIIAFSTVALADDEDTEVIMTWDGGGIIGATVDTGDSFTSFAANSALSNGSFSVVDYNNNPYNYGVDSVTVKSEVTVTNGYTSTLTQRLDSKDSMYGPSGQEMYSYLAVTNGTGSKVDVNTVNYASLKAPTYGYQLPNGHNMFVDAAAYELVNYVKDGQGNYGEVYATGNGVATLDVMSSEASGNGGIRLGWGCGCYTDANFKATGDGGQFVVTAIGEDQVNFEGMGYNSGGGTAQFIASWVDSVQVDDFSVTAN